MLTRVERLAELGTDRLLADAGRDVAHNPDVDVGLQQCRADLLQHLIDVVVGQTTLAADLLDDAFKAGGQRVEHRLAG